MADLQQNQTTRRGLWGYPVLLSLVLLVVANLALCVTKPLAKVDPDSLPAAHTWVWWAAKEYQEQKFVPKVVLLGSSLVMHPVSRADADYMGIDLDYVKHHRSVLMEQLMNQTFNTPGSVYNFALPGGMVSDDYIVTRALLTGDRKPEVLVLGLSLRDFIDNGVHCAGATPAFRYLKRYTDIEDLLDLAMPQIWQRFDYYVSNGFYIWGKKLDLQVLLSEQTKEHFAAWCAKTFPACRLSEGDLSRNQPSNLRSEVEEGMMIVKSKEPYSWENNSAEYKKRYRTPNAEMFATQKVFLDKLIALAKEKNIGVVLVNMPLTPDNKALMPAGSYGEFIETLTSTAQKYDLPFINLDSSGGFTKANFYDTSHMNGSGGKKLIEAIVQSLAADQRVAVRLSPAPVAKTPAPAMTPKLRLAGTSSTK
jgi:hypothetical protein